MIISTQTCATCCGPKAETERRFCSNLCYWFAREGRRYRAGERLSRDNRLRTLRQEALAEGVPWQAVAEIAEDLYRVQCEARQHERDIRSTAWTVASGGDPSQAARWSQGLRLAWGKKVAESDHTVIPRYDIIAQEVGWLFPEFQGVDGTERLWDFLLSPCRPSASWSELAEQALGVACAAQEPEASFVDEPFTF